MTMFSFRPLEEADAIRLLVLHPSANTTAPLSGSLIHTTLSKCDADFHNGYLALSYVWGDPAPKESIRLDGITLGIAASVAEALTQLRNSCPGGTQRIWVDALCINQWDIAEKNRQVPLMGNIYSTASTTVIYLGSLSAKIETIFKAVRENKPKFVTVDAEGKSHVAHPNLVKCFNTNSGDKPSAVAIEELLQLPWFTRVWVLQELMLSRDAWVQCGALRVRWRELCALLVPILDRTKGPRCTALQNMQLLHRDGKSSSLSTILQMREGCRASDPRDMIFGYMGMHTDKEDVAKFITVDYETPLRRLLISTARYIYHCDGLEVLLFCVKRPHTNNWLNLPSWVPDWGIYEWWHATSLGREITGNIPATIRTHEFVLSDVQNITGSGPHRNPKFIRHVSPILPRPQDVPQYVVDFLNKAAEILRWPFNEVAKQKFLEEENVSFWRYVDIGSTNPQNPNSIGLFPDSFWDPAAEVERRSGNGVDDKISCKSLVSARAFQTLSFFTAYVGSRSLYFSGFQEAFTWYIYHGQEMRLALSTAGFVLSVPAHVETGDVCMRLGRSSSISYRDDSDAFWGLMRPLPRETGELGKKSFKWLGLGGVPLMREICFDGSHRARIDTHTIGWLLLSTEIDNDGLLSYDSSSRTGRLRHVMLY